MQIELTISTSSTTLIENIFLRLESLQERLKVATDLVTNIHHNVSDLMNFNLKEFNEHELDDLNDILNDLNSAAISLNLLSIACEEDKDEDEDEEPDPDDEL